MFDTSRLDEALRSRRLKLEQERVGLLERVQEELRRIRRQHGIEAAYIVGSLKTPGAWRNSSDVDVAVRGCSHAVLEVIRPWKRRPTGRSTSSTSTVIPRPSRSPMQGWKSLEVYG